MVGNKALNFFWAEDIFNRHHQQPVIGCQLSEVTHLLLLWQHIFIITTTWIGEPTVDLDPFKTLQTNCWPSRTLSEGTRLVGSINKLASPGRRNLDGEDGGGFICLVLRMCGLTAGSSSTCIDKYKYFPTSNLMSKLVSLKFVKAAYFSAEENWVRQHELPPTTSPQHTGLPLAMELSETANTDLDLSNSNNRSEEMGLSSAYSIHHNRWNMK